MSTDIPCGDPGAVALFHDGEISVQERAGVRDKAEAAARRGVRGFMPEQHREFFAQLPYIVAGSVDPSGQPWASLLIGPRGFVHAPNPIILRINAQPLMGDPLGLSLYPGHAIGLLGIELTTRRRNRLNGIIDVVDSTGITVHVQQSFGNCPKYIQTRDHRFTNDSMVPQVVEMPRPDDFACRLVNAADTFFIATAATRAVASAATGVDVSHRGGRPGFVRIDSSGVLAFPDFAGNNFFNTLGNLRVNPSAGLLFIDFDCGDVLYLAGTAEIIWDGPEVDAFDGAERIVRMSIHRVIQASGALPIRWGPSGLSPALTRTGNWR